MTFLAANGLSPTGRFNLEAGHVKPLDLDLLYSSEFLTRARRIELAVNRIVIGLRPLVFSPGPVRGPDLAESPVKATYCLSCPGVGAVVLLLLGADSLRRERTSFLGVFSLSLSLCVIRWNNYRLCGSGPFRNAGGCMVRSSWHLKKKKRAAVSNFEFGFLIGNEGALHFFLPTPCVWMSTLINLVTLCRSK